MNFHGMSCVCVSARRVQQVVIGFEPFTKGQFCDKKIIPSVFLCTKQPNLFSVFWLQEPFSHMSLLSKKRNQEKIGLFAPQRKKSSVFSAT